MVLSCSIGAFAQWEHLNDDNFSARVCVTRLARRALVLPGGGGVVEPQAGMRCRWDGTTLFIAVMTSNGSG